MKNTTLVFWERRGGGVTLGEGVAMSTVEKGAILEKCLNTLSLFVACKDRRHFATLPDWFPSEKTSKERPWKFHTDDLPLS